MEIALSDHFGYKKLIRFTLPSIVMMIFTSLYTVVDGFFVSNVAGESAFAALNLIWPVVNVLGAFGFMVGTGGSAYVAKTLGEGKDKEANEAFSFLIYFILGLGIVLGLIAAINIRQIALWLGASPELLEDCVTYGRILSLLVFGYFCQNCLSSFLVTAQRPDLGLYISLASGFSNMILDYLLIYVFQWGITGAALATGLSWVMGTTCQLGFFFFSKKSTLHLGKTHFQGRVLLQSCSNGLSEMVSNLSVSFINILYNFELMKLIGADGVVAYGIIQYVAFVFSGFFFGYALGVSPVIGYQYGAGNHHELKSLLKKSLTLISVSSIILAILAQLSAHSLSLIFVSYSYELETLTVHAIRIYSLSYLLCGFNLFTSSFFTALNNGIISAALSFLRTFVFQAISIVALGEIFGVDGIWNAVNIAELLSAATCITALLREKKVYHY
jgi:putative MATE family efflux protein